MKTIQVEEREFEELDNSLAVFEKEIQALEKDPSLKHLKPLHYAQQAAWGDLLDDAARGDRIENEEVKRRATYFINLSRKGLEIARKMPEPTSLFQGRQRYFQAMQLHWINQLDWRCDLAETMLNQGTDAMMKKIDAFLESEKKEARGR